MGIKIGSLSSRRTLSKISTTDLLSIVSTTRGRDKQKINKELTKRAKNGTNINKYMDEATS